MENSGASQDAMVPPIEGLRGGGTAYGWNDIRAMHSSISAARSIDPAQVCTEDLLHVWVMPSTATVLPQEMPLPLEHISILAARNERESLQVVLRPKVSWGSRGSAGTVQFQCTDLCSTSGDRLIVGESLSLYQVVPVLGIPDALVPVDLPVGQICLHPGETSALWFSVSVPPTQPPGKYEGEITFTAKKADAEYPRLFLTKEEKLVMYKKLKNLLDMVEHVDGKPFDEVESVRSVATSLRGILLSPSFSDLYSDNGFIDSMEEDSLSNIAVHLKINLTVWDFVLPVKPSLPAVLGISDTVIEDRLGVEHGSHEWQEVLELHFKWLLQYRVSPYFCRWGDGMRVSAYTCPWPADHPKSDEYLSDPRLAAYAVPYDEITPSGGNSREAYLRKEVEILRTKPHWNKAYFYLWDEPLNMKQYDSIRSMASEIYTYSTDARVLTTYYSGPSDSPLASSSFESFVKVPQFLRPYTQIYCTSEWVLGNREDLVNDIVSEIQKDKGEEWWTYVCLGPSDPHPNWHLGMRGTQHRAVMWRVWKEGATGFLYWGANCYEKATSAGAEIKFRRGLPPGDGVLFYPGEVFSCHRDLIASVRLERILCGLQDIEYLNLYSSRYGRAQAVSLLERTGVYLGPEQYTSDHVSIDVMRGEIFNTCRS